MKMQGVNQETRISESDENVQPNNGEAGKLQVTMLRNGDFMGVMDCLLEANRGELSHRSVENGRGAAILGITGQKRKLHRLCKGTLNVHSGAGRPQQDPPQSTGPPPGATTRSSTVQYKVVIVHTTTTSFTGPLHSLEVRYPITYRTVLRQEVQTTTPSLTASIDCGSSKVSAPACLLAWLATNRRHLTLIGNDDGI